MIQVRITPDFIAWLADETGLNEGDADALAQEFITRLHQAGGLCQLDATVPETAEERLELCTAIKSEMVSLHNILCELAATFEDGKRGILASQFGCSTQAMNTWAEVFQTYGKNAIAQDDVLDPSWWRAACQTNMLEDARLATMSAAQMRKAAGLVPTRNPPRYDGGGTVQPRDSNTLVVHLDSPVAVDELEYRATVRVTEREQ